MNCLYVFSLNRAIAISTILIFHGQRVEMSRSNLVYIQLPQVYLKDVDTYVPNQQFDYITTTTTTARIITTKTATTIIIIMPQSY